MLKRKIKTGLKFYLGEWIYFGDGETFKNDIVLKCINGYLNSSILYVASTRTESIESTQDNVMKAIEKFLVSQDFSIWDSNFNNVVEFDKIGVLRQGQLNSQKNN